MDNNLLGLDYSAFTLQEAQLAASTIGRIAARATDRTSPSTASELSKDRSSLTSKLSYTPKSSATAAPTSRETLDITDIAKTASYFKVTYTDLLGETQDYNFSLLPAIESKFSSGPTAQVPEVKPGILLKTSMNIKRFLIAGGPPVFQTLGIEQTMFQIVGLFIGNEGTRGLGEAGAAQLYRLKATLDAQRAARVFDQEVVQPGRPVTLSLFASSSEYAAAIKVDYKCLLQNLRVFIVRSDRVYYSLDALVLEYAQGAKTSALDDSLR